MQGTSRLVPLLVLALLVVVALQLGSAASAKSPAVRTLRLTELEKGSTFAHIRNTKPTAERSNAQGDLIVFTNPVADPAGKIVGTLFGNCTTTLGAKNFLESVITCTIVMSLRDGTLTGQVNVSPGVSRSTGAITGGTGAYANARGVVTSKEGAKGSIDTITLVS
jgi:hypothetical protein